MNLLALDLLAVTEVAGRVCVGLVFLLAGAQKLSHWRLLPGVIANYHLLPRALAQPVSAILPPLELVLGALLLSGWMKSWVALVAIGLLALFAAAMAINLKRGRAQIDCGCGQSFLKQSLRWTLVWRNALLAVLLLPLSTASVSLSLAVTGVSAGLGFFLLYLLVNTLAALPRSDARSHRFA
jgi:uncharacterized membrane protein YphA (DoxX/SURF4 family)